MEHLLERRESLVVNNEIWEFPGLDGWKAFVVDVQEGDTGYDERNRVRSDSCEPFRELRLESY
jgi:hypothetical protein